MNTQHSVHYKTCPLCDATCGLKITTSGESVIKIEGDDEDVFSQGFICPKGARIADLHTDPDRLRGPVYRNGTHANGSPRFEDISWARAFELVENSLKPHLERDRNGIGVYLGNPIIHSAGALLMAGPLLESLGTMNLFTASTIDNMAHHVYAGHMFGDSDLACVPDIDHIEFLIIIGANPWVSNGSEWTAPNLPKRLLALIDRGGSFVVIDPRRTETARHASKHHFIYPGSDAFFLASVINSLFKLNLVTPGRLAEFTDGLEDIRSWVAPFTGEVTEAITGISVLTVETLARELAAAKGAAIYGRMGLSTSGFGSLAVWLMQVANVLTGNLDREGGVMFPLAATSAPTADIRGGSGFKTGRYHSRVHKRGEVRGEFPVADLADEISASGNGRIRCLITFGGNPVLSVPDSKAMDTALEALDFLVCVDPYINETTRHADIILPPPSLLEKSHYDVSLYHLAVRNIANFSPSIFSTDSLQEHEIFARLALIAQGKNQNELDSVFDATVDSLLSRLNTPTGGPDQIRLKSMLTSTEPLERVLELMIRLGPYGDHFGENPTGITFDQLKNAPHGIDFGPLQPRLPGALKTENGRMLLTPLPMYEELQRLGKLLNRDMDSPGVFRLIGRRQLQSNNSWLHNVARLRKGSNRCTLLINTDDARKYGISDGVLVHVSSSVGRLDIVAELTPDIMPGVVSIPHGWGHDKQGTRLTVASKSPGVNINELIAANIVDPISGTATLNGINVKVSLVVEPGEG